MGGSVSGLKTCVVSRDMGLLRAWCLRLGFGMRGIFEVMIPPFDPPLEGLSILLIHYRC